MSNHKLCFCGELRKLEAQVGQKSLAWIRLIMICYIVTLWLSWQSDQIDLATQNLMLFEEFQIATMATILDIGNERLSNSESPCHPDASYQVSAQSVLLFGKRLDFANFKTAAILDTGTQLF